MPCLYNAPERKSTSKAPKRVLRVRAVASIRRASYCALTLSPFVRGLENYATQTLPFSRNSHHFIKMHGQTKTSTDHSPAIASKTTSCQFHDARAEESARQQTPKGLGTCHEGSRHERDSSLGLVCFGMRRWLHGHFYTF